MEAQEGNLHYLLGKLMREGRACPNCDVGILRPIIYGLVRRGELREKADRGEIVLGGCQVGENAPDWACLECGTRFDAHELDCDR